jgi:hypothetical protein
MMTRKQVEARLCPIFGQHLKLEHPVPDFGTRPGMQSYIISLVDPDGAHPNKIIGAGQSWEGALYDAIANATVSVDEDEALALLLARYQARKVNWRSA